jgi:hypothetical protein
MSNLLPSVATATSGERDVTRPQVRDRAEPFLPDATNTVNSGEAAQ